MSKFNPVAGSAIIPGVEILLGTLGGGVPPGSPILTLFQTTKCYFPDPFSDQTSKLHTPFQAWRLSRNYVITS